MEEIGFLLEEEGSEATALGAAETLSVDGAMGEMKLGTEVVIFQAEVEVQVVAVEKAISKEEGEVAAEVDQVGILSQRNDAGTDFFDKNLFDKLLF